MRADGSTWYSAALVRIGEPLVHLCEPDGPALRDERSLLLKAEGLWAEHECEAAFEQWTVANEAYAVALDDPAEAVGSAYGHPTPIAFDWEWYARDRPEAVPGGYRQAGEVHAVLELQPARVEGVFNGSRSHRWGSWDRPGLVSPTMSAAPVMFDGRRVDRALSPDGWTSTL